MMKKTKNQTFRSVPINEVPARRVCCDYAAIEGALKAADSDPARAVVFFDDLGNVKLASAQRTQLHRRLVETKRDGNYNVAARNGVVYVWKSKP